MSAKGDTNTGWAVCRPGNHTVRRNRIVVFYGPGVGLCCECILHRCGRVRDYWTKGRAPDAPVDARGEAVSGVV